MARLGSLALACVAMCASVLGADSRPVSSAPVKLAAHSLAPAKLAAPAPPPLPVACPPFHSRDGAPEPCAIDLREGWTYTIYTECASVKGDTQLRLLDDSGVEVAFNECVAPSFALRSAA